jgi:hypothetical protein
MIPSDASLQCWLAGKAMNVVPLISHEKSEQSRGHCDSNEYFFQPELRKRMIIGLQMK